jgi:hypothetical protein
MADVEKDTTELDDQVDAVWGEAVVLRPMKSISGGYREALPDPERIEVIAKGIYDQGRGAPVETGGGMAHRQATVDSTLSIRHEPVDKCKLRKGDRVYFPVRKETHEVTFIFDDPGGRPDVHLVRVLEEDDAPVVNPLRSSR